MYYQIRNNKFQQVVALNTAQLWWETSGVHQASHPLNGRGPQLGIQWAWWFRASHPLDGRAQGHTALHPLDGRGSWWWSMGVKPVGGGCSALYPRNETGASGMGSRHWALRLLRNSSTWASQMGGGPGHRAHGTPMRHGQHGPIRGGRCGRHTHEADGRGVVVDERRVGAVSVQVAH